MPLGKPSTSGLGAAARRTTPPPAPVTPEPTTVVVADEDRPVKFTAKLTPAEDTVYARVTESMRRVGRLARGRYPSRADVLRAMLAVVDQDPAVADQVADRIRADLADR